MSALARIGGVRWVGLFGLVGALTAVGCGASSGPLSGKVSYNGALLKGGNVTFISTAGKPSQSASIGEDGSYSLDKIAAGPYKVCVETESLKPSSGGSGGMPNYPGKPGGGVPAAAKSYGPPPGASNPGGYTPSGMVDNSKRYVKIPPQYGDPEQTPLKLTASASTKTFDIDLK